jgi:hypothetical protein
MEEYISRADGAAVFERRRRPFDLGIRLMSKWRMVELLPEMPER